MLIIKYTHCSRNAHPVNLCYYVFQAIVLNEMVETYEELEKLGESAEPYTTEIVLIMYVTDTNLHNTILSLL